MPSPETSTASGTVVELSGSAADHLTVTGVLFQPAEFGVGVRTAPTVGAVLSAGKITGFHVPGGTGVRVDTAAYAESTVPPYYDSLIAKLIVHGDDRAEAISRMARALEMFIVEGISTSIPVHEKIMADPDFRAGNFDTRFLARFSPNGDI